MHKNIVYISLQIIKLCYILLKWYQNAVLISCGSVFCVTSHIADVRYCINNVKWLVSRRI